MTDTKHLRKEPPLTREHFFGDTRPDQFGSVECNMLTRTPEAVEQYRPRIASVQDLSHRMGEIDENLARGYIVINPDSNFPWGWLALCGVLMAVFGYALGSM